MTKLSVCRLFVSVLCVSFLFLFSTIFMLHVFYGLEFRKLSQPPPPPPTLCVCVFCLWRYFCTTAHSPNPPDSGENFIFILYSVSFFIHLRFHPLNTVFVHRCFQAPVPVDSSVHQSCGTKLLSSQTT